MADTNGVVVVVGDPLSGITVYGPYATTDDALNVWELESDVEWWISPLRTNGETVRIAECDRPWCVHCKDESND